MANAGAGLLALAAWRFPRLRGRPLWAVTAAAEVAIIVQVTLGVALLSAQGGPASRFHMFYGFVAFITVGIAYSARDSLRGRVELLYGFVGLFLMGLALRAWQQVY